jgi:monoterpene epsilon-lactone hydrolase
VKSCFAANPPGLCFALTHKLKELGLPVPRAIVGISPWTDLTLSGASCRANQRSDPSLRYDMLASYARMYAADDLKNPLVSPLFGDVSGFPPTLLFAGEAELLLDDAVAMAHALKRAGVPCELHTAKGMWHVYVLYGVREAREALRRIVEFLKDNLAVRDLPPAAGDDEEE